MQEKKHNFDLTYCSFPGLLEHRLVTGAHTEKICLVVADLVNRITSNFTKSKTKLYLFDSYVKNISGSKFPSNKQALGYFLFIHHQSKLPTKHATAVTIERIFVFWNKANILVRKNSSVSRTLKLYFINGKGLLGNVARKTSTQRRHVFYLWLGRVV